MERKAELAARTGIRLFGVTSADLGNLHDVFAPWLPREARPALQLPSDRSNDPRLKRPTKPRSPAARNSNSNAETRTARLERSRRAVALQGAGQSRAAICEQLGVGPNSVKELLRDGKFYADPNSDPSRLELALEADEARTKGMTKGQFRQARGLTPPKANECWKDADVLYGASPWLMVERDGIGNLDPSLGPPHDGPGCLARELDVDQHDALSR